MVFQNGMIAVIKCQGQVLRECSSGGEHVVVLPFGTDYSILLKNKDSRSAIVDVEIDGQSVTKGKSLVVSANTSTELLGFMENGVVRNMFRFIKKTGEIAAHRGSRIDDGILRVEFRFEQRREEIHTIHTYYYDHNWYPWVSSRPMDTWSTGGVVEPHTTYCSNSMPDQQSTGVVEGGGPQVISEAVSLASPEGITVKGAETYQQFCSVYVGQLESQSYVINILLRGTTEAGMVVESPITVSTKLKCSSCGREWDSTVKYCGNCGTALGLNLNVSGKVVID